MAPKSRPSTLRATRRSCPGPSGICPLSFLSPSLISWKPVQARGASGRSCGREPAQPGPSPQRVPSAPPAPAQGPGGLPADPAPSADRRPSRASAELGAGSGSNYTAPHLADPAPRRPAEPGTPAHPEGPAPQESPNHCVATCPHRVPQPALRVPPEPLRRESPTLWPFPGGHLTLLETPAV